MENGGVFLLTPYKWLFCIILRLLLRNNNLLENFGCMCLVILNMLFLNRIIKLVDYIGLKLNLSTSSAEFVSPSLALAVVQTNRIRSNQMSFAVQDSADLQVTKYLQYLQIVKHLFLSVYGFIFRNMCFFMSVSGCFVHVSFRLFLSPS